MRVPEPSPSAETGSPLAGLRRLAGEVLALDRRSLIGGLTLAAAGGLAESFGLVLVIPLLALAAGPEAGAAGNDPLARSFAAALAEVGIEGQLARIGTVLALFAAAVNLRAGLVARRELAMARIGSDFRGAEQARLASALGAAPWQSVSRVRHGAVTHVLGSEIHRLGHAASALAGVAVGLVLVAVQLGLALLLDWRLTLVALALLAAGAALGAPLLAGARRAGAATSTAGLTLQENAGQFLGALKLAVGQNLQARFVAQVGESFATLARAELGWIAEANAVRLRITALGALAAAGTAFVGLGLIGVPAPRLLALLLVLSRLAGPLAQVQGQGIEAVRALPARDRVRALEAALAADALPPDPAPIAFEHEIAFEHVTFAHGGTDGPGLAGASLVIPKGSFIGIAGPSGAGKTTLADLLVGLLRPDSGMIRVDGAAVDFSRRDAWRDGLAYVAQDAFLRAESLRANLAWAVPGAPPSDAAMHEALRIAGAEPIVARMGGLDAPLGERGSFVSGGERQRLAVARALLRRPRLLVLDEATNALDPEGEADLLAALDALRPELTIVMIAHRPAAFARCTAVWRIEDGRTAPA